MEYRYRQHDGGVADVELFRRPDKKNKEAKRYIWRGMDADGDRYICIYG